MKPLQDSLAWVYWSWVEARAGQPTLLLAWIPLAPWLILEATAAGQLLLGSIRVREPVVGSIRAQLLWATASVWRWLRGGTRGWGGNVAHPSHQTGCFPGRRVSCGKILGDKFVRRRAAWRHTPGLKRPALYVLGPPRALQQPGWGAEETEGSRRVQSRGP